MKRVYITLDFICNNDCLICANTPEERKNNFHLTTDEIKKYLSGMGLKKGDFVEFSGGEPTIRDDILDLCKFFNDKLEGKLVLLTNARRLADNDFAKEISRYIDRIVTAFYSSNPEKHDAITQRKGSFKEAYAGVKNMERLGVNISIKTIPMKLNYMDLSKFVEFAFNNFKNPIVFFSGLDLRGYAKVNQNKVAIRYTKIKPFLEKALDCAEEMGKKTYIFTMPMCIIDPVYWEDYSMCMGEISKDIEFLIPGRSSKKDKGLLLEKPSKDCYECILEPRCFWGWKGYVGRYGSHEFKSLKKVSKC